MKETREKFLFFLFGDYEGVRRYLDRQARRGWELVGKGGFFTCRFARTNRQELIYDVTPSDPRRTPEELRVQVRFREEQGWQAVDTVWGMDIYKSMPCQSPTPLRREEDYRRWRAVFRDWLLWSAAFVAITAAVLLLGGQAAGMDWAALGERWYLSDARTALLIALPAALVSAVLWLGWLMFCLLRRCKPHRGASPVGLWARGLLQLGAVALLAVALAVVWLEQVPRLWLRLLLAAALAGASLFCRFCWRENRQRRYRAMTVSVFVCLAAAMVLGWVMPADRWDTLNDGAASRRSLSGRVVQAEDLGLETEGEDVMASYEREASLLVCQEQYYESWSGGTVIETVVYTCAVPALAETVLEDVVLPAAEETDWGYSLTGEDWYRAWVRMGRRVICLAGTPDWTEESVRQAAIAAATA